MQLSQLCITAPQFYTTQAVRLRHCPAADALSTSVCPAAVLVLLAIALFPAATTHHSTPTATAASPRNVAFITTQTLLLLLLLLLL
jgi:hypothetical protein